MKNYWIACTISLLHNIILISAPFAYVTNGDANTVSVINLATNTVITTINEGGPGPFGIEITPNNKTVYVANFNSNTVTPIDIRTNKVLPTIKTGLNPTWFSVTATCNGKFIYVSSIGDGTVTPIDTKTNTTLPAIKVGNGPVGIGIVNNIAYVCNLLDNNVSMIDITKNVVIGNPIPVGIGPTTIAITPDGKKAYIPCTGSDNVYIINIATNSVIEAPISLGAGTEPFGIAITPNGEFAYVTNNGGNSVSVLDLQTNTVLTTIPMVSKPWDVAIEGTGKKAYVVSTNGVVPINIASNIPGPIITVGSGPIGIDITELFVPIGKIKKNIFLDRCEKVLEIRWQASPSNVDFYRVYNGNEIIGTIPADGSLKFLYCIKTCATNLPILTMTAVDKDGTESSHLCVLIND